MANLKFVAAFLAAFTIADLYLNKGQTVHAAWYELKHGGYLFNEMIASQLPRPPS